MVKEDFESRLLDALEKLDQAMKGKEQAKI